MSKWFAQLICIGSLMLLGAGAAVAGPGDLVGGKIAHLHLSGELTETPQEDPFGLVSAQVTSFKDLLRRLTEARKDDSVKAVVLTMDGLAMGAGQLEELHDSIAKFKAIDKRVFVHVDGLSMPSLAMLSVASDLGVVPTADAWLTGLYAESPYFKGMLDKIGVEADILQMEEYKSAGEMLTRTGPSEPAEENLNWLLDGLYDSLVGMIADGRGLSETQVRKIIDEGPYTAEETLEMGLVDAVQYRDEFLGEIRKIYGKSVAIDNRYGEEDKLSVDLSSPFAVFEMLAEMFTKAKEPDGAGIGIVYVEGMIVPGHAQPSPFGGSSGAYSGDISKALYTAADDPSIKAVVLRVDSPGGSALASEVIWRATQIVRGKKPIVVSMGNVAGSGGYYVACGADHIFADEMTITASIGVVGGKLVTTGGWDKLGVNWVPYKRGDNADLLSTAQRFTPQQREDIREWMDEIYGVFKDHVVQGRKDKLAKPIDELAGGRVYTGKQAVEVGLVDKIGGLAEAVEHAARMASISDYELRVIPKPRNFLDMLMQELTGQGERPSDITVHVGLRLLDSKSPLFQTLLPALQRFDPLRVQALIRAVQKIELIHREGVVVVMPQELIIR